MTKFDSTAKPLFASFPPVSIENRVDGYGSETNEAVRLPSDWPLLPWPRGPLSSAVISALQRQPGTLGATPEVSGVDALSDDDFELALYLCYEVHYRGLADADWEWDPGLLRFRAELEKVFEGQLRDHLGSTSPLYPHEVVPALDELITASCDPSLSMYLGASGTLEQLREFCVHRSAYQLKEADPHTFGIPRLTGEAKAAMALIQYDEYGSGDASRMHSTLFGNTMTALGLDASHGSYIEVLPGVTLATVNLVSMFALHRRWRAALVGHLAVFEMTSAEPMARYGQALARLGVDPSGRHFFDVHADVDAHHAEIARDRMVAGLVSAEPLLGADLLFGAAAVLMLEQRFGSHLLDAWSKDRSSLVPWEMSAS
ncbi:MAG TPA: iron-containing redox enzyme family protein [Acidimicrobiales bacterium]|nr:iron-containing redox enzyme family protein [Acidimicrobiales bacterium]